MRQSGSIPMPDTCDVCGKDQSEDKQVLLMADPLKGVGKWWHNRCVPADLRALLISRGWEFPPLD